MIYPDTGVVSSAFQFARSGIDARLGLANATGGVHGRKIVYSWRDDESDPAVNLAAARSLVERQGAFGLIELTSVATGSAAYLDEQGIPVTGIATEAAWSEHRNMFAFTYYSASGPSVTTFGMYARSQGGSRAIIVDLPGSGAVGEVSERIMQSLASQGIEVVGRASYTSEAASPPQVAAQLRSTGADVLIGVLPPDAFVATLRAVNAARIPLRVALGPAGYTSSLLSQYGSAISGMTVYTPFQPFEVKSPALETYRNAVTQYAPELDTPDREITIMSYIATDLFIRGLEAAGPCPTREGFIQALRKVSDYDANGLTAGKIDLDKGFGGLNTCYTFVRVNQAGSAFEVVRNTDGGTQWCGQRLG
jgi:ABC-type branched-subunit amino acid transport system substrate-binding protein